MPTVIQLEPFSHILAALMDGVSSLTYAKKHDMRHLKYSDYAAFLRCSKAMWELGSICGVPGDWMREGSIELDQYILLVKMAS